MGLPSLISAHQVIIEHNPEVRFLTQDHFGTLVGRVGWAMMTVKGVGFADGMTRAGMALTKWIWVEERWKCCEWRITFRMALVC